MSTLQERVAGALASLSACASTPRPLAADPVGAAFQQPMRDLSLIRDQPREPLRAAVLAPYAFDGAQDCVGLTAEVAVLDGVLGPDVDVIAAGGKMADGLMANLIGGAFGLPYRGVVRAITGAARRDRAMKAAILAGMVRRGFLKGRESVVCVPAARTPWRQLAASGVNPWSETRKLGLR